MKRDNSSPRKKSGPASEKKKDAGKSVEPTRQEPPKTGKDQVGGGPYTYNQLLRECLESYRHEVHDPVLSHTWRRLFNTIIDADLTALDALAKQMCHERYKHLSTIGAALCFLKEQAQFEKQSLKEAIENIDVEGFVHIWEARQNADLLGADYGSYIQGMHRLYGPDGPLEGLQTLMLRGPWSLALAYRQLRSPQSGMPLPADLELVLGGGNCNVQGQ